MLVTTVKELYELEQILTLQKLNLRRNQTEQEIIEEGFVTCEHELDLLSRMNTPYPHVIAKDISKVVGYSLVMLPDMRDEIEILKPMFELIDHQRLNGSSLNELNYFVMGQVCIAKDYRGQGLLYSMYNHLYDVMSPYFDLVITEISSHNKRSLKAHANQGFQLLHSYIAPDGHPWEIVVWQWS